MVFLLAISAVALAFKTARADKRSPAIVVQVQVVESCRVEPAGGAADSVDLSMRCSSTARATAGLAGTSRPLPAVGTLSLSQAQIAVPPNGPPLSIDFWHQHPPPVTGGPDGVTIDSAVRAQGPDMSRDTRITDVEASAAFDRGAPA